MLAVIIPTLNAQDCLPPLLAELDDMRVVISDGGSKDDTLDMAIGAGAVIARGVCGRGAQMARGAELSGAVDEVTAYLFIHADCRLLSGWKSVAETALKSPETAWFFEYDPEAKGRGVTWLRFIVWLRGWAWRLPYGDQALLIPRDMYEALGGYDREKPLFEDVDIVDRIKSAYGRKALRKLPIALKTDISGHLREGVWTRGWRNYRLLKAYRRGESAKELVKRY
ncbi:glycosyl transferase family 2 [Litorimonas sp. WD9-15]|uniref:glycosyl transferase family 2 n=1 Tax=Litorimonas sp. WD9-15 TaxID=3418716 RepID=UPI003D038AE3